MAYRNLFPHHGRIKGEKPKSTFGKRKAFKKKRTTTDHELEYLNWCKSLDLRCVICDKKPTELHHVIDMHRIDGKTRDHKRVIPLCIEHHRIGKDAIHRVSREYFYENIMTLDEILTRASSLYDNFINK